MPSRTSAVRLRPRPSRSSTSTTRSDCSLWWNARPKRSREHGVERLLAGVPERRVPEVVAQRDRLGQVLVEPQRAGDRARDPGRLERVRQPRADSGRPRVDEDLRLVLEAPERLGVDDPVAVALERRAHAALVLLDRATPRVVRAHGERREACGLLRADPLRERVCHSASTIGHPIKRSRARAGRRALR